MRFAFIMLITLLMNAPLHAQETFSGRLVYSLEYLDVQDDMKGVEEKLPPVLEVITDGSNWRIKQKTLINGEYSQVYISDIDSIFETFSIGPERVRVSYREVETVNVKTTKPGGPRIIDLNTEICEITSISGNDQSILQLESFSPIPSLFYDGLSGIPALIEMDNAGVKMRLKLVSLKSEPIDETYFALPEDYKPVDTALYMSWLR